MNVDIDECSEAGSCGVNAVCNNNYGSYSCTYYGNRFTCTGQSQLLLFVYRNGSILKTFVRTDSRKFNNKGFLYFFTLLGFRFLFRGIYYITPHYYSLFEKLVAALIVTEERGAETIYT